MRISRLGGQAIPGKGIDITPYQPARAILGAVDHRSCSIVRPERVQSSNPRSDLARALSRSNTNHQALSPALDPCLCSIAKPAVGVCTMVHGQGKSRPVVVLDLQTGEVIQTLPSVAAVAKTFFKKTKDCTDRNRVQKALDKAQASGNSYSTLVTDVPGYVAGFAWAWEEGDSVSL